MLQRRLQRDAAEETPAGTPEQHLSSPHGALHALQAAAAAQPHAGNVTCKQPQRCQVSLTARRFVLMLIQFNLMNNVKL